MSAIKLRTPALLLQLCRGPHLINENLEDKWILRPLLRSDILGVFPSLFWQFCFQKFPLGGVIKGPGAFLPLMGRRFGANTQAGLDAETHGNGKTERRRAGESLPPVVMQEAGRVN